jgi:hypothetical protein
LDFPVLFTFILTTTVDLIAMDPFTAARDIFLAKLSPTERSLLQEVTEPRYILVEIQEAEKRHHSQSTTRKLLQRINPFVLGIEQYGRAFDILSNVKPGILSLLWGGALLALHVRTPLPPSL